MPVICARDGVYSIHVHWHYIHLSTTRAVTEGSLLVGYSNDISTSEMVKSSPCLQHVRHSRPLPPQVRAYFPFLLIVLFLYWTLDGRCCPTEVSHRVPAQPFCSVALRAPAPICWAPQLFIAGSAKYERRAGAFIIFLFSAPFAAFHVSPRPLPTSLGLTYCIQCTSPPSPST